MIVRLHRLELPLEHEFTIARESTSIQRSLVVELEQDGISGFGESTENQFYGHSIDSMSASIQSVRQQIESFTFGTPSELWQLLSKTLADDLFALAAIDLAAHDLCGKRLGKPTYQLLGLTWSDPPESSYTIGIDRIDKMVAKLQQRPDWSIYKIKLGTDHDVEIVRTLRQHTDAVLRVDANCGWRANETIENSAALKELGVQFIEQPLPRDAAPKQHELVYQKSLLPIVADESCIVESDVQQCVGLFHAVNVKLCKCGGLTPGLRMLKQARRLKLKTMVGCMCESSVAISAASQLLPMLDYADLDGAVLLAEDPAVGTTVTNGKIELSNVMGNGVTFDRPQ